MRKKTTSLQSRYRANVQLEMLEPRQLLSTVVSALGKFTIAPRPSVAAASVDAAPTYQVLSAGAGLTPLLYPGPEGYTPAQITTAYGLNQVSFGSVAGDGTGQTIAIIDAYNDPTIQNDLAAFDTAFGLPAASLTVVNQTGGTKLPGVDPVGAGNDDWEGEESLDVEWAHAIAPGAKIILVEATDPSDVNLNAAIAWARQAPAVSVISMSFGSDEAAGDSSEDAIYTTPAGHQGITFVASTGDSGEPGGYPAYSPNVVAAGGTTLTADSLGNYDTESGWSGSGGGISISEPQPSYQNGVVTQSTTFRTIPDVSFDADPNTGVAVYDSYDNGSATPWEIIGGTSFSAPAWAAIFAITDQGRVLAGTTTLNGASQTLPLLYAAPQSDFHDITSGNNGFAAGPGYDLVTGRGSPKANLLIPYLIAGTANPPSGNGPTITSILPSNATITAGTFLTLTAVGVGDPGATGVAVQFYIESNGTDGLQTTAGGDQLIGAAQTNGSTSVTFDTTGLSGEVTFYAQVTDDSGAATANGTSAVSTTVDIVSTTGSNLTIGAVTASFPVVSGQTLTLQATGGVLGTSNSTVRRVRFYEETNGTPGLQTGAGGDQVFPDVSLSSNYTLAINTSGLLGEVTFYAVALNSTGIGPVGTSAPSVTVDILQNSIPDAPSNLTATALSTTSVQLTFSETNSGQTGYEVQRSTEPSFTTFTTFYTINRPTISQFTDAGLSPGTRYFYRVAALSNTEKGPFSYTTQVTTFATPTKLGFASQPASLAAGSAQSIVVNVETAAGAVSSVDNSNVTLSIGTGPSGATLGGMLTVQAVNGVATFSNITLTEAGTYTLLASDADLAAKSSAAFTVGTQASSAHLVLVQQPANLTVGVKESPAYVVKLEDQYGNVETAVKSKVTLSVASGTSFTPKGTIAASLVKGVGTLSGVILNGAGNYVLHLTDSTFGSVVAADVTVGIATTTIVTPKSNSVKVGHPLTLAVQLKSNAPSSVPFSGTVTLLSGGVTLGTAIVSANGVAKFVLANLAAGTYPTTVSYAGDLSHTAAQSSLFTLGVIGVPTVSV